MQTHILNYRIIIEPDTETGTEKPGYTATCPTLGIAADGDTIENALANIKSLVRFHLKCLKEEGEEIPEPDRVEDLVTNMQKVNSSSIRTFY
jgi:predicted RNase H-like HicB family nuclease